MSLITGFDNEYEFVKYLNGKKVNELNPMFRELIEAVFYNLDEDKMISCWRNHYKQKADILIRIGGVLKGISIKKGIRNSVHVERLSDFTSFLRENKVDDNIILEYLKYHFGDGTINGTGKIRLSAEEYKLNHKDSIDMINKVINQKDIIKNAVDRFVIKGKNSDYYIDAIVYGEVNDFVFITRKDIFDFILSKREDYSGAVHLSVLTIQPKNRCLNRNKKYNNDRYCVQIKWYNLYDNIIENMNNKVMVDK